MRELTEMPLNTLVKFYEATEKLDKLENLQKSLLNKSFIDFLCEKLLVGISGMFSKSNNNIIKKIDDRFLKLLKDVSE